jgi:hypothetical protein
VQVVTDARKKLCGVLLRSYIHEAQQFAGLTDASNQAHTGRLMTVFTVPSALTAITL